MPESKVRDTTAKKKSTKPRSPKGADHTATTKPKKRSRLQNAAAGRDWVPWVFVPLALLGVIWLLLFYIAGNRIPVMQDLRDWNYLIGIGLIAVSFGVATLWK